MAAAAEAEAEAAAAVVVYLASTHTCKYGPSSSAVFNYAFMVHVLT